MTTDIQFNSKAVSISGGGFRVSPHQEHAAIEPQMIAAASVDLQSALKELAVRTAQSGAELQFRVDQDSGRVIVSIVDPKDGTVLRQIPGEEALRIARMLAPDKTHLIQVRA
ncbi:MAG: flagellar protein FlaG [Panacagrimonas sp.]